MVVGFSSAYTSPALVSMTDRNVTSFDITDSQVIFFCFKFYKNSEILTVICEAVNS